jgi:hypothetical protein|tara:strand:- start:199 stop:357 length:159 start_codon:yes stop_codon:yes gene_type:complete
MEMIDDGTDRNDTKKKQKKKLSKAKTTNTTSNTHPKESLQLATPSATTTNDN